MERIYKGKSLWRYPDDYTVIDIETNGFFADTCEILEISAIKYRSNRQVDIFSTLIKPQNKINAFITRLTGITDDMAANGEDITTALTEFKRFAGDDILLGYNVNFDINFLYDNMMKYLSVPLQNDYVDVLRFARKTLKNIANHKQTTVAQYFGIDVIGAHRAEKDCLICNAIYGLLRSYYASGNVI